MLLNMPFYVPLQYKEWTGVIQVHNAFALDALPCILKQNFFEQDLLIDVEQRIGNKKNIIDIGACIGNHSLFFAGPLKSAHVFCIEPLPILINMMSGTFLHNQLQNISIIPVAAGNKTTNCKISNYNPQNPSSIICQEDVNGNIKMDKIDNLIKDSIHIDCIKIDASEATFIALEGCEKIIDRCKPTIYINKQKNYIINGQIINFLSRKLYLEVNRFGIKDVNEQVCFIPIEELDNDKENRKD